MNIIIVGGTGFLGYHAALEFLKHNHKVAAVSLPDIELGDWYPSEIDVTYGNVFEMEETALIALFRGFDAMVYSVGPDDRIIPTAPAYDFFYDKLVRACTKVVRCARLAGVKKTIVTNSYFAYFDRLWPHKRIAENHAYVQCRIQQAKSVINEGKDTMSVCVLELPFIFGSMPVRLPLWKDVVVKRLLNHKIIFFPKGGSNMISVQGVAQAFLGAIEHGEHGQRYIVGDVNMRYVEMLTIMMEGLGIHKPIVSIPDFLAALAGRVIKYNHTRMGLESGLDPVHYMQHIFTDYLYIDDTRLAESKRVLNYTGSDIRESIIETMLASR